LGRIKCIRTVKGLTIFLFLFLFSFHLFCSSFSLVYLPCASLTFRREEG
jgi:hypothetical protein